MQQIPEIQLIQMSEIGKGKGTNPNRNLRMESGSHNRERKGEKTRNV